jgi:DNA (cytosine-5)-methyltransferase 1
MACTAGSRVRRARAVSSLSVGAATRPRGRSADDPQIPLMSDRLTFIDLFAGLGGLSDGFLKARRRGKPMFEALLLVDRDPVSAQSFKLNYPKVRYLVRNIADLTGDDVRNTAGLRPGETPDLIIGGPPCQGFSIIRKNKHLNDSRNAFLAHFLRLCGELQPRMILIENVKNIYYCNNGRFLAEILARLADMCYIAEAKIINAHEFGVPQLRERIFIAAFHADSHVSEVVFPNGKYPPIRFAKALFDDDGEPSPEILTPYISVEGAIGDLPSLKPGKKALKYGTPPYTDYQYARRRGATFLRNHDARNHSREFLEKLARIQPGGSNRYLEKESRFDRGRLKEYFSQAYAWLHADGIAYTITTHFQNPGSGRFTHYRDLRALTVREAARLQGFDDTFVVCGTNEEQMEQVGNAVPPILARALAEHFGAVLLGDRGSDASQQDRPLEGQT